MNSSQLPSPPASRRPSVAMLLGASLALPLLISACASKPTAEAAAPADKDLKVQGKADGKAAAAKIDPAVRALQTAQKDLDRLHGQTELAALVPQELADADAAMRVALNPSSEPSLAAHQRYMAEKRVQLARARAEALEAVNRLQALAGSSGDNRLAAAANSILPSPTLTPPPVLPKPPKTPKPPKFDPGSTAASTVAAAPISPGAPVPAPPVDAGLAPEAPLPIIGKGATATAAESLPAVPASAAATPVPEPVAPPPAPAAPLPTPAAPSLPPAPAPTMSEFAATGALTLPATVFSADGNTLTDSNDAVIAGFAASAKASGDVVEIDGLTGDAGTDNASLTLAQHRAEAVKRALVALGLDPARISASAMGEYFPPGVPVEPRSARVEVRIQ